MKEKGYTLQGYDKDADAYETLCMSPLYDHIVTMAKCVANYHTSVKELRRTSTGEPFDWFVVCDKEDDILMAFTSDEPEGFVPGTRKEETA